MAEGAGESVGDTEFGAGVVGVGILVLLFNFIVALVNDVTEEARTIGSGSGSYGQPGLDFPLPVIGLGLVVLGIVVIVVGYLRARPSHGGGSQPTPSHPGYAPAEGAGGSGSVTRTLGSPVLQTLLGVAGLLLGIIQLALA